MNDKENRQIRIFISSTFQDMQAERDYLIMKVFPRLQVEAANRDVTIVPLDLRWGITEEESISGKVLEICLQEIENSHPFFIGLLGNRYGSHPELSDLEKNPRLIELYPWLKEDIIHELSITEIEMQYGVLRSKQDINAYFYIKEGEHKEYDDINAEKIERLKEVVQNNGRYPVERYISPEDLGEKIERDFMALLNTLYQDCELSEMKRERLSQQSFLHSRTAVYIPNERNYKTLDIFLGNTGRHELVITGSSGMGKSALIANWIETHKDDDTQYIIYHFIGNGVQYNNYLRILKRLIDEIKDIYQIDEDEGNNDEVKSENLKEKLTWLFSKIQDDIPLVIVLDGINQMSDADFVKQLNWLPLATGNIKYLFSTIGSDATMDALRSRGCQILHLQPLSETDRYAFVEKYLGRFRKSLTKEQISKIINNPQSKNTLILKTLLDELIACGIHEQLDSQIDYYLETDSVISFFQRVLERHERDYGEELVKHSLSLIAVSRDGMSEQELLSILGVRPIEWSQFYCSFLHHLMIKNGQIVFSHQYVKTTVITRYISGNSYHSLRHNHYRPDYSVENKYRMEICDYFKNLQTKRAWVELAFQYSKWKNHEELYRFLLNLRVFKCLNNHDSDSLAKYWNELYKYNCDKYSFAAYLQLKEEENLKMDVVYNNLGVFCHTYLPYIEDEELSLKFYQASLKLRTDKVAKALTYSNMGAAYHALHNYDKALECLSESAQLREEVSGAYHKETARLYCNIGVLLIDMNKLEQAEKYLIKSLDIRRKLLGEHHVDTGINYKCLGNYYVQKEKLDIAEDYYTKALIILERHFGQGHKYTIDCYKEIEKIYIQKTKKQSNLVFHQSLLAKYQNVWGNKHPKVVETYKLIGDDYRDVNDFDNALKNYLDATRAAEDLWGYDIRVTPYYISTGELYEYYGEYQNALDYYNKSLLIRENLLGYANKLTAENYRILNNIYNHDLVVRYYQQRIETAKSELEKARLYLNLIDCSKHHDIQTCEYRIIAYKILERVFGENDVLAKDAIFEIAKYSTEDTSNLDDTKFQEQIVRMCQRHLGKKHTIALTGLKRVADNYISCEEYNTAIKKYNEILVIMQESDSQYDFGQATIYNAIGQAYFKMEDFNNALFWHNKALDYYHTYGEVKSNNIAETSEYIAGTYVSLKDYDHAISYYQTAISHLSDDDKDMKASCLKTLGDVYEKKDNFKEAIDNYLESLSVWHNHIPFEDYNHIATLYVKLADYPSALNYLYKSYECRVDFEKSWKEHGKTKNNDMQSFIDNIIDDSLWIAKIKRDIAYIYQLQHKHYKALRILKDVLQNDIPEDNFELRSNVEQQIQHSMSFLKADSCLNPFLIPIRNVLKDMRNDNILSVFDDDGKELIKQYNILTELFDDICKKYNLKGKKPTHRAIKDFAPYMPSAIAEEYLEAADSMLRQIKECHPLIKNEFLRFQDADDDKLLNICEQIEDELIQGFLVYYIEMEIIAEGLLINHIIVVQDVHNRDSKAIAQLLNGIIRKVNKANSKFRIPFLNNRRIPKIEESDIFK